MVPLLQALYPSHLAIKEFEARCTWHTKLEPTPDGASKHRTMSKLYRLACNPVTQAQPPLQGGTTPMERA